MTATHAFNWNRDQNLAPYEGGLPNAKIWSGLSGRAENGLAWNDSWAALHQSLSAYQSVNNKQGILDCTSRLVRAHTAMQRYTLAGVYADSAAVLLRATPDADVALSLAVNRAVLATLGESVSDADRMNSALYELVSTGRTSTVRTPDLAATLFQQGMNNMQAERDGEPVVSCLFLAAGFFQVSLWLNRKLENRRAIGATLINLGRIYVHLGQIDRARACYEAYLPFTDAFPENDHVRFLKQSVLCSDQDTLLEQLNKHLAVVVGDRKNVDRIRAYHDLLVLFHISDEDAAPGKGMPACLPEIVRCDRNNVPQHLREAIRVYESKEWDFTKNAHQLPQRLHEIAAIKLVADMFAHPLLRHRTAAADALGDLGVVSAIPALRGFLLDWLHYESLTDTADSLRGPAACALAKIAAPETGALLVAAIEIDCLEIDPGDAIRRGESIRQGIKWADTDFGKNVLQEHAEGAVDEDLVCSLLEQASDVRRLSRFIMPIQARSGGSEFEQRSFGYMVAQAKEQYFRRTGKQLPSQPLPQRTESESPYPIQTASPIAYSNQRPSQEKTV